MKIGKSNFKFQFPVIIEFQSSMIVKKNFLNKLNKILKQLHQQESNYKIKIIVYKEATGNGLIESKDFVEDLMKREGY